MLKFFKGFSLKIRSCVNFFHSVNVVYHIHQCVYVEPSLYPIVLVRLLVSMTNTWYLKQFRVRTIYYAISFPSLIPVQSQLDSWLWTYTRQTIAHAGGGGGECDKSFEWSEWPERRKGDEKRATDKAYLLRIHPCWPTAFI